MTDWIPVSSQFPPDDQLVMVYGTNSIDSTDRMSFASYKRAYLKTHYGYKPFAYEKPFMVEARWSPQCGISGYEWDFDIEPTHWALLPEQPTAHLLNRNEQRSGRLSGRAPGCNPEVG